MAERVDDLAKVLEEKVIAHQVALQDVAEAEERASDAQTQMMVKIEAIKIFEELAAKANMMLSDANTELDQATSNQQKAIAEQKVERASADLNDMQAKRLRCEQDLDDETQTNQDAIDEISNLIEEVEKSKKGVDDAKRELLTHCGEFNETLPSPKSADSDNADVNKTRFFIIVLAIILTALVLSGISAFAFGRDQSARTHLFLVMSGVSVGVVMAFIATRSLINNGKLGPMVSVISLLAFGLMAFVVLTNSDGTANGTRVLITGLFVIGTLSVAIILVLTVTFGRWPKDVALLRFARGKEIFTGLLGILGTIIGFYFGTAQDQNPIEQAKAAVDAALGEVETGAEAVLDAEEELNAASEAHGKAVKTTPEDVPDAKKRLEAAKANKQKADEGLKKTQQSLKKARAKLRILLGATDSPDVEK